MSFETDSLRLQFQLNRLQLLMAQRQELRLPFFNASVGQGAKDIFERADKNIKKCKQTINDKFKEIAHTSFFKLPEEDKKQGMDLAMQGNEEKFNNWVKQHIKN